MPVGRRNLAGEPLLRAQPPADNTAVAAPCDLTQQQLPTVVAQDIDIVGCSPDDIWRPLPLRLEDAGKRNRCGPS